MPHVSIGLPVYNGENYLDTSIASILSQTYTDFELIISDNASNDRTEAICKIYAAEDKRIRYHKNTKNYGAVFNYNRVFQFSTGKYFKWMAHDDVCAPNYLKRCVEVLDEDDEVVLCFPKIYYIDSNDKICSKSKGNLNIVKKSVADRVCGFVNAQRKSNDIFWSIFGLIRKDILNRTGLLGRYVACDQVLLLKLLLNGHFCEVPEYLFFRRVHSLASTVSLPASKTYRERANWYDTKNPVKFVLPNWHLIIEIFSALKNVSINSKEKKKCYYLIGRMFALRWKRLIHELASIPTQIKEYQ